MKRDDLSSRPIIGETLLQRSFKISSLLFLEPRQYKNDFFQSKMIQTLKLLRFFTTYTVREKARQIQNWNYFWLNRVVLILKKVQVHAYVLNKFFGRRLLTNNKKALHLLMWICWLDSCRVSWKYKNPMQSTKSMCHNFRYEQKL